MVVRARDIRADLAGKCEPRVMHWLEALAEHHVGLTQQVTELALMLDQMANLMKTFTDVAANIKSASDMVRHQRGDEDAPPVTR